ncbi:MAG TPA: EcsC family protein [Candidatus Limnocylindrales bacterium]|nr:EcsC family protein [Candidatus Limnocylindrales bacterium]
MLAQERRESFTTRALRSGHALILEYDNMTDPTRKSWMRRGVEGAVRSAFMKAYSTVKVNPEKYLDHLRMAYNLPASTYEGMYSVDPGTLDHIAEQTIRAHARLATVEGAGLGLGGMFTMLPDLGILAAITLRMIQKLSLIYGFPYNTEEEEAELWVAAASAAGVDISRELLEKQFVSKFVPRVIQRIAVSASAEIVEKWTARLIPLVSSAIGAGLNHYFVKVWGERAMGHFRQKHLQMRSQQVNSKVRPPALPAS